MAEGQVAQAFGGKVQAATEFKTASGMGVKVFVRPASVFVTEIEKWLKDNELFDFKASIVEFNGMIAAFITYHKNPKMVVEESLKDTAALLVDLVGEVNKLADKVASIDTKPKK